MDKSFSETYSILTPELESFSDTDIGRVLASSENSIHIETAVPLLAGTVNRFSFAMRSHLAMSINMETKRFYLIKFLISIWLIAY